MTETTDRDKLRILLPHWIEHNNEHTKEFYDWADKAVEARAQILEAAAQMEIVNHSLQAALDQLGGALDEGPHEHSHQVGPH